MILLLVAALLGGSFTFAMLLPYGILSAFIGAPLGGSFLCLLAGLVLALLRSRVERSA
ncbi:small-conductance mechanosensitive channel [Microvirga flocculans]|uniref:Small-conductance mechanosensitive channel n=1 Tax=Microvirga flocculans TaxID=217168 RepID=A0A7W6N9J8_9HYPH|nr:small-conductance mechanosensitive channel [Microvirga flocculans]